MQRGSNTGPTISWFHLVKKSLIQLPLHHLSGHISVVWSVDYLKHSQKVLSKNQSKKYLLFDIYYSVYCSINVGNWIVTKPPLIKPNFLFFIRLQKLYRSICDKLFHQLPGYTGQNCQFIVCSTVSISFGLCISVIEASFHASGKFPCLIDSLKTVCSGCEIIPGVSLNVFGWLTSRSGDLCLLLPCP